MPVSARLGTQQQNVVGRLALGHRPDLEPLVVLGRHVLRGVHGQVDPPSRRASRIVSIHSPSDPGRGVGVPPSSPVVVIGPARCRRPGGEADPRVLGLDDRKADRRVPIRSVLISRRRGRCRGARPGSARGDRRPGSERSFSSTIGSWSSFAATPAASASTAARSSGVSEARRDPSARARPARPRRRGDGGPDQRREGISTTVHLPAVHLLADELMRPLDLGGGTGVVFVQAFAERHDVDHPDVLDVGGLGSTSRGTARSSSTSGRPRDLGRPGHAP